MGDATETAAARIVAELLRQAEAAAAQHGPGLYISTVAHDDWCNYLNGRGPCNCEPQITTKRHGST